MNKPAALALALGLVLPIAASAETQLIRSSYVVEPRTATRNDAVLRGQVEGGFGRFYGGVRAETVAAPEDAGNLNLYLGLRPTVGAVAMDVSFTRNVEAACCGAVALNVGRPVGRRARIGARFYFDASAENAGTEARASVTVARGVSLAGGIAGRISARDPGDDARLGFDFGLTRKFTDLCNVDVRYRDAIAEDAVARMMFEMKF